MCLGLALGVAVFAAEKRPDVTIVSMSMKKYEIVIDGKSYMGGQRFLNLEDLRKGRHTIQVYEVNRGMSIFKRRHLVSSQSFMLRNVDMRITIDRFGKLSFDEQKFDRDERRGDDRRNGDWDNRRDRGRF